MSTIKRFEDIQARQQARELTREIYNACARGSLGKDFALRDQICRAAVSSMSNIAEGFSRNSDRDFHGIKVYVTRPEIKVRTRRGVYANVQQESGVESQESTVKKPKP